MMSDSPEDVAEDVPHDEPSAVPSGAMYKVVLLKLDEQGVPSLVGDRVHLLSPKIYDRRTAIKYAVFEAQQLPAGGLAERILAVINPGGRCIAVIAGVTGKPVRPLIAMRTKRALATLMPGDVKVKRRTSRPLMSARPGRPGRRRTSRGR